MSGASLALEGQAPVVARRRDRPVLAAWALVATGALLVTGALVLLALIERAGVPSSGHPSAGRVLVRIIPGACMLVLGALVLAHLPRHPLGWILCAAGLGTVLAGACAEYATYSHYVDGLPAGAWVGLGQRVGLLDDRAGARRRAAAVPRRSAPRTPLAPGAVVWAGRRAPGRAQWRARDRRGPRVPGQPVPVRRDGALGRRAVRPRLVSHDRRDAGGDRRHRRATPGRPGRGARAAAAPAARRGGRRAGLHRVHRRELPGADRVRRRRGGRPDVAQRPRRGDGRGDPAPPALRPGRLRRPRAGPVGHDARARQPLCRRGRPGGPPAGPGRPPRGGAARHRVGGDRVSPAARPAAAQRQPAAARAARRALRRGVAARSPAR